MSEPQRLGEILPEVMQEIEARCNRHRERHGLPSLEEDRRNNAGEFASFKDSHQTKVLSAVGDFMKSRRPKRARRRPKWKAF